MLSERLDGLFSMCERAKTPPGLLRAGRCRRCRSVAVRPAAARADQAEGLAAFVIEEVGVDRCGEARIVERAREIVAALRRALRPSGADFNSRSKDPVARRVVAGPVGLRNDADALGLDAQGDDLALELAVAGLLDGPDVCHFGSPWLFEPATIAASMAIDRPQAIDDAPARGPEHSGGWRRRDFLGSRGMGEAQGKKVSPAPLRQGGRGAAVLRLDQAIKRPRGARARQPPWEKTWRTWSAQEAAFTGRRKRNPGVQKGGHAGSGAGTALASQTPVCWPKSSPPWKLKRCEGPSLMAGSCDPAPAPYPTE